MRKTHGSRYSKKQLAFCDMLENELPLSERIGLLADCARAKEPWAITLALAYDPGKPEEHVRLGGEDDGHIPIKFDREHVLSELAGTEAGSGGDSAASGDDEGHSQGT